MSEPVLRCLVTGATGYVGSRLVPRLVTTGHKVRAMARTPAKLDSAPWRGDVEVVRGDLMDPESLVDAFTEVDVVYYLVHAMGTSDNFTDAERQAAHNVAEAAVRTGVQRIVYLGGLHPPGRELSTHLSSRVAVGEILLDSGVPTVVLQAGVVVGTGSASFEMIRHLTDRLPVMTTPKWVSNKIQPIAVRDVLHYLTEAATADFESSRTWDIGGPDVLEYGDMMQIYAEQAGLSRRRIIVLPFLTPTIASWWVGLVTPIPGALARPLVESLECDAVMREHDIDAVIPPPQDGLLPYEQAVARALDPEGDGEEAASTIDPGWAGEIVYTDDRSALTKASGAPLFKAVEQSQGSGWTQEERVPPSLLRLRRSTRIPGTATLEMRVEERPGGSRYDQHITFTPRGLVGQVYWYAGLPLRRIWLRRRVLRVVAGSVETR